MIRLKRQVLMSQRSTWLWAIRTDMSADARSALAAVDGFCAFLGLALIPLLPSLDFLLCHWSLCVRGSLVAPCSRLLRRSVFAVARSLGVRCCSVDRDGAGNYFFHVHFCVVSA